MQQLFLKRKPININVLTLKILAVSNLTISLESKYIPLDPTATNNDFALFACGKMFLYISYTVPTFNSCTKSVRRPSKIHDRTTTFHWHGCMDGITIDRSFDSHATSVIDVR